jgi:hypothetical protein
LRVGPERPLVASVQVKVNRPGVAGANHERTTRRERDVRVRLHLALNSAVAIDDNP